MADLINPLKVKLVNDEPVIGTILTMPSPHVTQLFSASGFDWLLIDREHGAIDADSMQAMINVTKGTDTVPLVRVPVDETWIAKTALDAGALGIFFPLIVNAEQARAAVAATKYPPAGTRGFGPFYAPSRWGMSMADYAASADQGILRILMIEHTEAVRNIDEILDVPGIDVAFIAPFDLSQSLDIPGQFEHPDFIDAVKRLEQAISKSGVTLGGLAATPEKGRDMIDHGYKVLMMGFDTLIIETAARDILDKLRS
jgi:4-hydroxy-2-oxoheptanedioate aldolase